MKAIISHVTLLLSGNKKYRELTRSAEAVACGELPHTRKELCETTAEQRHADDDIGGGDATGTNVVKRQNQRR